MQELFNPNLSETKESKQQSMFFNPSAQASPDKKYSALIRFVPWWEDPRNSILKKETAWLKNDVTNESRVVDSPATVGERCPIKNMFFTLWNSNHQADKEMAKKKFSVRTNYYSLVQVIEDKNNPENNGKILIWRYGFKIFEKITLEREGEYTQNNPFNVLTGRYFNVNVKVVDAYNNYDACSFIDIPNLPKELQYYNDKGEIYGHADASDQEALLTYLQSGPSLNEVAYQPWDDSTREFVDGVIRAFTDPINYTKTLQSGGTYISGQAQQPYQQMGQQMQQPVHQTSQSDMFNPGPAPATNSNQFEASNPLAGMTSDINSANQAPSGNVGSESIDGLNFDDILNNQMF